MPAALKPIPAEDAEQAREPKPADLDFEPDWIEPSPVVWTPAQTGAFVIIACAVLWAGMLVGLRALVRLGGG